MKKLDFKEIAAALNNVRTAQMKADKTFSLKELKEVLFNCGVPRTIEFWLEFLKTAWVERVKRGVYRWNPKFETIPMKYLLTVYQRSLGRRRIKKQHQKEKKSDANATVSNEVVEVTIEEMIESYIRFLSNHGYRIFKEVITLEEVTHRLM